MKQYRVVVASSPDAMIASLRSYLRYFAVTNTAQKFSPNPKRWKHTSQRKVLVTETAKIFSVSGKGQQASHRFSIRTSARLLRSASDLR